MTHVHIYRGQLIFGDAIEIIKVARKQKAMKNWDIEVELQY